MIYFHVCVHCHDEISMRAAAIYSKLPLMCAAIATIQQHDVAAYAWQYLCKWLVAVTLSQLQ